jgi:hypothetical protein
MHRIVVAVIAALVLLTAVPAFAQTPKLKVRGQLKYVHGINNAWFVGRNSNDIGLNPFHPEWGCGYNTTTYEDWIQDIDRMNVNVMRIWLFEGHEGLEFDTNGYASGIQAQFLTNLDDLMARLNNHGLAAEFVLFTHYMGDDIGQTLPNGATLKHYIADPNAKAAMINNVIIPLATRYRGNLAVFSYDLINEADILTYQHTTNNVTWAQLKPFITDVTTAIHTAAPGTQVTVSGYWQYMDTQSLYNMRWLGTGLDFLEVHDYNTTPNLENPANYPYVDKPVLLGEYGPSGRWTENVNDSSGNLHIQQAKDRGYAGSMAWMYYNSNGNAENIAKSPGGDKEWFKLGFTIQNWGTTLGTGTGVTETPPPPHSTNPFVIYADALASGWVDQSWDTTFNYASTTQKHAGTCSIMADSTGGWSALSVSNAGVSTSGYNYVTFWVYGSSARYSRVFTFALEDNLGVVSPGFSFTILPKTWTYVSVPLNKVGSPTAIYRMWWQQASASQIEAVYIDDVRID